MSEHALYSADGAHGPGHYSPAFLGCTATLHAGGMLPTMFSFRGHVTSGTLTLQRFLSSTKSIIERKSANVNLRPFRKQLELIYEEDHYPSLERREIVAQDLGVPIKSLSRWFIYRYVVKRAISALRLLISSLQSYHGQKHPQSSRTRHKHISPS